MYMEKEFANVKIHLHIDTADLETELVEHPMRLQAVTEIVADTMRIRDACSVAVKFETANAAERLRVAGDDGKMPSETKINSQVLFDPIVMSANEALAEAEHDLRYWSGMEKGYSEKGSSLKRISELTIAGYLAPNQARKQELKAAREAGTSNAAFVSKRKT